MGALGNTEITITKITQTGTGRNPSTSEWTMLETRAWMKNAAAERVYAMFGEMITDVYSCRLRTPRSFDDDIRPGWNVTADGDEYEIIDATQTGRTWRLMLKRLS